MRTVSLESAPGCKEVAACSRSLVGCSRSLASRSEQRLRYAGASARESCRRQEPMAASRASGCPVRPSLLRGCERAISRARARAEPARRTRSTLSVEVSHRAASEPVIFPGIGQHEVWQQIDAEHSKQLDFKVTPVMPRGHADAREGPGGILETLSGWARIPECVPRREIGTQDSHLI
jgi:hypothetical protein